MTYVAHARTADRPVARSEQERFVALAFCWADLLVEIDADRTIRFAAGPTERMLGRAPASLHGQPLMQLFHPASRLLAASLLDVATRRGRFDHASVHLLGSQGQTPPMHMAGYCLSGLGGRYYIAFRQLPTARHDRQSLSRDAGTGLYDADSFATIIGELVRERAEGSEMTLIALNGFERVRERLDGPAEAAFLTALGSNLRASSVDGDSAARLADDRYLVLHGAGLGALELQDRVAALARDAGAGVAVESASLALDDGGVSGEDAANGLVYMIHQFRSARGGDFNMRSLSSNLPSLVADAVKSIRRFRDLLAAGDFDVALQPIVDVATGDIQHYEALCRFRRALSDESPYGYITFAEETGLIPEFDLAMTAKVLQWLGAHRRDRKIAVAVNVSGRSVASPSYALGLAALLDAHPWTRGRLIFEITGSAKMENLEAANGFIQGLRRRGYRVCLDDFGTGAANFQYLGNLDVDVVKFDGSAIANARRAAKGEAFLKALVGLCRELGVKTVAEMIDDAEGLNFVRRCGVDYAQGYLFGKPSRDISAFHQRPTHLFTAREWL